MSSDVQYTEEEFIIALKNREAKAFNLLYDRYAGALYGYLSNNYLSSKRQKEEILKDVFILVWNDISRYNSSKCRLFTWIFIQLKLIARSRLETRRQSLAEKIKKFYFGYKIDDPESISVLLKN